MRKSLFLALALLASPAFGQVVNNPTSTAPAGAYNSVAPTCIDGKFCLLQTDLNGNLKVTGSFSATTGGFVQSTSSGIGTPISVTTDGVTGTIPLGTSPTATEVIATNVGTTNGAYCQTGASATTSSQYIAPNGGWFAFALGSPAATQLTCITGTSTTTVNMVAGAGLPTGTGGGGGGGTGAVTQGTIPWADNVYQWAGGTLGAMANYGTSPGAVLVPGFNAYVTNIASGTAVIGAVSQTKSVCVTPTVTTANAYGANYVVGGLLTFANVFNTTGSGMIQSVVVTIGHVETNGFTFVPFNSNPSATTWTDAAVANINATDVPKQRNPIALGAYSGLGTATIAGAVGLGQAMAPGTTGIYGVLISNAALTNNFTSASEVQVCVKTIADP